MKRYRITVIMLLAVGAIAVTLVFLAQVRNSSREYKVYSSIPGMTLHYPSGMVVFPDVPPASEAGFKAVAMSNFTPKVPFFFPAIDYLRSSEVFIEINEFDAERWKQIRAGKQSYPEEVYFVGKGGLLSGDLMEQKILMLAGQPAIQRRVRYRGARGALDVWFTYFESGGKPFQAILLSGSSRGISVYETMLSALELKR
jgi:hypothetical protein